MSGKRDAEGIVELQRSRLLSAAIGVLAEEGYGAASVAAICDRAGVSRRTYYEIFDNREECLAAILTDVEQRLQRAIAVASSPQASWRERIRIGMWEMLCLADREPALARVCVIESQRPGGLVAAERERILARLAAFVEQGRAQSARTVVGGALTAEALVGAVAAVLAKRLPDAPSLRGLLGELTSMILLPYLGPSVARSELGRPLPAESPAEREVAAVAVPSGNGPNPLAHTPVRLTYRTARVLQAVVAFEAGDGGPSNRQIAEHAGVVDPGQISRLLSRLERHGLLENAVKDSEVRGEANSWSLTDAGRRLAQSIGALGAAQIRRNAA